MLFRSEIQNLLTLSEQHRNLWKEAYQREELQRVFREDVDLLGTPATVAEEEFLNVVIVQFQVGWHVGKAGGIITTRELSADVRGFFRLPLPRAAWEKTKAFRNPRFVRFVDRALGKRC